MEVDAERTLHNLRVLAALSQNDKLLTNEDTFDIHPPTTTRALMRFWSGERRANNVQRVRICVRAAMEFISKTLDEASAFHTAGGGELTPYHAVGHTFDTARLRVETIATHHFRMLRALIDAGAGLCNLLQTYRDDPALVAQVQLISDEGGDYVRVIRPHSQALKSRFSWSVEIEETPRRIPPS